MAKPFEAIIRLQMARFSPQEARKRHIAIARAGLADFMGRQPVRPMVRIETDNRPATSEGQVKPFGLIVYRFDRMREVASFALREAEEYSPVRSGRYKRSWFLMHGTQKIGLDEIPASATIILTNDQPYSRKINVGAKGFEEYMVPSGIVERVRQKVRQRYGSVVTASVQFIQFPGGGHVLTKSLRSKRSNGRRGGFRSDSMKGMAITYPALVLTPRV